MGMSETCATMRCLGWAKLLCFVNGNLLKGPKHEIFESRFFTEIRPVRIGDLGIGEKK
jgi:hypothetical protein